MKKLLFGLFAVAVAGLAHGDIFDDAVSRVKEAFDDIPDGAAISVARAVLARDEAEIVIMDGKTVRPSFERFVFVFVDDFPGANWAHPCRYVIFNEDLSEHEIVRQTLPPSLLSKTGGECLALTRVEGGPKPVTLEATVKRARTYANALRAVTASQIDYAAGSPANSYFLVIAGGANQANNGLRFWSDAAMYYSTLTLKYKVPKENIVLLVSDGRTTGSKDATAYVLDGVGKTTSSKEPVSTPADLDGDGVADVTGPATYAEVKAALDRFADRLGPSDQLTVFITSHGNVDGGNSYAFLFNPVWTSEVIFDYQLAELTKGIGCPIAFALETCYSGGFIDDLCAVPDRVVATACSGDQMSWGGEGELQPGGAATFDGATHSRNGWAYPFNCAMRGNVPKSVAMYGAYPWEDSPYEDDQNYCLKADSNGDGRISFREASNFATENDQYAQPGLKDHEDPQFWESTAGLGERFFTLKDVEPVSLENPIICDTAKAASNRMAKAAFTPSAAVETKLGKWSPTLTTYRNMFTFKVVPTSGGKWAVAAVLTPEAKTRVNESAQAATRLIPVGDIAALAMEGKKDVRGGGCVPGFYYALRGFGSLEGLGGLDVYGPELCGAEGDVTFPEVKKPSDVAGFFSIGVKETPDVNPSDAPLTIVEAR